MNIAKVLEKHEIHPLDERSDYSFLRIRVLAACGSKKLDTVFELDDHAENGSSDDAVFPTNAERAENHSRAQLGKVT